MPVIFLLAATAAMIGIIRLYYKKNWTKRLFVTLAFQDAHGVEGEKAYVTETIRNEKRLVLPMLHVKFQTDRGCEFGTDENAVKSDRTYKNDLFSLQGRQMIKRTLSFTCRRRGIYRIDSAELVTEFLFFRDMDYAKVPQNASLAVYPAHVDVEGLEELTDTFVWAAVSKSKLLTDPFSFAGIREYQPYDPVRTINWKATARTGGIMVNTFEKMSGQPAVIAVNLETPRGRLSGEIMEESIRIAYSWAKLMTDRGMFVSLVTNRDTEEYFEVQESIDELGLRLAMIDTSSPARPFLEWAGAYADRMAATGATVGIVSCDQTDEMRAAAELIAEAAGAAWLVRPGFYDSERARHSGRLSVLERWVDVYDK